jgi:predicted HTH transcriptional regulator
MNKANNTGPLTMFPSTATTVVTSVPLTLTINGIRSKGTPPTTTRKAKAPNIESAVYAYIQAVRALGKTKITPEEIAAALDISISDVRGTIEALKNKGVKALHAS